jgi:hypothetical protein
MNGKYKIYSSLFDIGRVQVDGRSISKYKIWLEKTIKIFPGITVFHNGTLNDCNLDANLTYLDLTDLRFYQMLKKVSQVIKNINITAKEDITFLLPAYSLVQLSKFEIANFIWESQKDLSLLWVDAGISRFINETSVSQASINDAISQLEHHNYQACFEIDLNRNINYKNFKIRNSEFGTCKRVISGTSFWLNSSLINGFYNDIHGYCEELINQNKWDNEQVILRNLIPYTSYNYNFRVQGKMETGSVARDFGSKNFKMNRRLSSAIRSRL